jgi:hypothetical protein
LRGGRHGASQHDPDDEEHPMPLTPRMFAAGGTVAGLGALAAIALAAGGEPETTKTVAPVAAATPQVRTEIVRTTVHVTKRAKPKTTSAAATPAAASAPAAPPTSQRASVPAAAAPAPVAAVQRTRSDDDAYDDQDEDAYEHEEDGWDDEGGDDD